MFSFTYNTKRPSKLLIKIFTHAVYKNILSNVYLSTASTNTIPHSQSRYTDTDSNRSISDVNLCSGLPAYLPASQNRLGPNTAFRSNFYIAHAYRRENMPQGCVSRYKVLKWTFSSTKHFHLLAFNSRLNKFNHDPSPARYKSGKSYPMWQSWLYTISVPCFI